MTASSINFFERVISRDRWLVSGALILVAVLAWAYTLAGVGMTPDAHAGTLLAMWWIMMIAMMLPSAAPTILLAAAINRRSRAERPPFGTTASFATGYLLAWLFFSTVATIAQWSLQTSGVLSAMLRSSSDYLTGALLLLAGLWQFTPAKRACLRHCRSPVEVLTRHRRPGNYGALVMGALHGSYCLGCCWMLMALLFAGGVMNMLWIVGLTLYVLAEKWFPHGERIAQATGILLILSAVAVFAG
jgi:predicted metal-binding membrane protein